MPAPESWAPVFLIGCGRSGTTILGKVLNERRDVHVLNEPRYLWRAINPSTDIWYRLDGQPSAGGRLAMSRSDVTTDERNTAGKLFYAYQLLHGRKHLVEKLPINSFRVGYLKTIFPKCRFIHIVRHGLEVAHSIAREGERWYGPNDGHKWKLLVDYANSHGYDPAFMANCDTYLAKGLMEWTLSVEAATAGIATTSSECVTVSYRDLIDSPTTTLGQIEQRLKWTHDDVMHAKAEQMLQRRNKSASELAMPSHVCDRTRQLLNELESN